MHADTTQTFDQNDPHHFSDLGEHHGHHINSTRTLVTVILVLVAFTGLTVFASQVETFLTSSLGWYLPDWVNIVIAMSIAVVKGVLVLAFFMGLKHENPLYTIVILFCMFTFALFLGFTGLDLDNRGHVDTWKQSSITPGGLGGSVTYPGATFYDKQSGKRITFPSSGFSGPLTEHLRTQYIAITGISEAEYQRRWAAANHITLEDSAHATSDANRSVPRVGPTDALDLTVPAEADDSHAPGGH